MLNTGAAHWWSVHSHSGKAAQPEAWLTAATSELAHRYKDLGKELFKGLLLVDFSQFLRKSPLDMIVKLANELTDLADVCALNELAENCGKSLHTLVGEKLCSVESLGDLAECCAKQEPERNQCFLKHKDDDLDIPPLAATDPSAICTAFHQFEQKVLGKFIYEIARRHPYFYGPELLYYTQEYKGDLTECCEAADKAACLGPKLDALQKKVQRSAYREEFKCSMLQNSGENALRDWFVSDLTKRFPNADFMMVSKLATDFTTVHKECCQSDMLECADDRADLTKYMCENQASISPTLKECCNKPVLEKSHCLAEKTGVDSTANLAANLAVVAAGFVEKNDICKNYMEAKDDFLGKFLYEYSKRHPDYPVSLLLRLAKRYEATLEKCCASTDVQACYSKVFDEFQPLVSEPHELVKKTCEVLGNLGEYGFQNVVLVDYTKKVPQVSTPTLVDFSRKFARAGSECCKLSELQRTACSEDYLFKVLDRLCVAHEKSPVSDRVTKCCTGSLVNRPSCFSALEVDETYVPKELSAETFTFHADVCTLPEPEQQVKKQTSRKALDGNFTGYPESEAFSSPPPSPKPPLEGTELDKRELARRYMDLGEEYFRDLVLVTFSQFLRKYPLDDIRKITDKVTELAKVCAQDKLGAVFCKLIDTPFTAKLCSITSLPVHYDEMADCCEAEAPLRYQCFVKHKDDELNIPPMGTIDSDATCTAFKENEKALLETFVVRLSQKFPFADFGTVSNLATNFTKVHKECCQSDMLECADDRADLAKYMCENRAAISTMLADCCNKPALEKFYCLAQMAGDNLVPAHAPQTTDFVENEDVCTYYKEAKVDFLNKGESSRGQAYGFEQSQQAPVTDLGLGQLSNYTRCFPHMEELIETPGFQLIPLDGI
ncbi:Serum albumin [Myotis davidii]|uniref:Albumin n=1 Tax=Myotis davidii TaxID=225400 RepID=L5LH53_MYODS|nr:Serum albumin [Myotis davidii]